MKGSRVIFLIFLVATACLDPYNPRGSSKDYGYLVVDSFVNSSDGSGTVLLSQTKPLNGEGLTPIVADAQISLEDENGVASLFSETTPGKYQLFSAPIDPSKKYKIKILTGGHTYESDLVPVVNTPPIDSVTWKQTAEDNVEIYVNTHDDNNNTRYYRWRYDETWHYTSAFYSSYIFHPETRSVSLRERDDNLYDCYQSSTSSGIIIASTIKLQNDVVSNYKLTSFPITSIRMQHLYSISVQQQALSKEQHEYFLQLKQTTESLGTLFDPQPSQVTGNIHCKDNAASLAIGYFSVGSVDTKRIFVSPLKIDFHHTSIDNPFYQGCTEDTLLVGDVQNYTGIGLLTSGIYQGPALIGYGRSEESCVDCRLGGGTNVKPDFWP